MATETGLGRGRALDNAVTSRNAGNLHQPSSLARIVRWGSSPTKLLRPKNTEFIPLDVAAPRIERAHGATTERVLAARLRTCKGAVANALRAGVERAELATLTTETPALPHSIGLHRGDGQALVHCEVRTSVIRLAARR